MLVVASDRVSVFDVVLPDLDPRQGPGAHRAVDVLVRADGRTSCPTTWCPSDPTDFPETAGPDVAGRAMLVRAAQPVRLECVARGYLFGSAWSEYQETGTVKGRRAAGRACARPSSSRSRSSRPPPRPTTATTCPLTDAEAADAGRRRPLRAAARRSPSRSTSSAPTHAAERGADPRRHQVRVRRRSTAS